MRASPGADRSHPSAGTRWRKNYRAFRPCGPLDKFGIERAARRGAAAPFCAGDSDGKVRFRSCGARWESAGDRKRVMWGKSVSGRVDVGGGRILNKNKNHK